MATPIPSWLNNAITGQNNLAPNNVANISGNLDTPKTLSSGSNSLGTLNSVLSKIIPGNLDVTKTPAPNIPNETVPVTPPTYNPSAPNNQIDPISGAPLASVAGGNMNNPLAQYSNSFGQNYANQNMGGYNPVAKYHQILYQQGQDSSNNTGPYSIPKGPNGETVPLSPDMINIIRKTGDDYYHNQLSQVGGEAQDMMSNIKTSIGGILGKYPQAAQSLILQGNSELNDKGPEAQNLRNAQSIDQQAHQIQEELKTRPANATDDVRAINLLMGGLNPGASVGEGEYNNGASVMSTLPGQVSQYLSSIGAYDPKTNTISLAKLQNSKMSDEARKAVFDAIHAHAQGYYDTYKSQRDIKYNMINNMVGGDLDPRAIPDIADPNMGYSEKSSPKTIITNSQTNNVSTAPGTLPGGSKYGFVNGKYVIIK